MEYQFTAMSYIHNLKTNQHAELLRRRDSVLFIFRYFCLAKFIWVRVVLEGKIKQNNHITKVPDATGHFCLRFTEEILLCVCS